MVVVFYVFFFKQKTAYEVRISDWSSDVCSSDLLQHLRWASFILGVHACDNKLLRSAPQRGPRCSDFVFVRLLQHPGHKGAACADAGRSKISVKEIGRESCRERVCPYV